MLLAFNDECLLLVAIFFLLQHNEVLKLASKGVLVLVVMYPIATHLVSPEVSIAMCKMRCCKALYCYTLVMVAIGEAPLLPLKCFGCYM